MKKLAIKHTRSSCRTCTSLLLLIALVSLVLPVHTRHHPTKSPKKSVTKKKPPRTTKYEEYSDDDDLSSVESPELPSDYKEQIQLLEDVRDELLNNTAQGRAPNPLPPAVTNKRVLAVLTRDLIDDLMAKLVIMMGDHDRDKIKFILDDDYHTTGVNIECYRRVVSTFSKFCINIDKSPYMNRFTNIFVNICDAKWLPAMKIKNGMRQLCEGINKNIAGAV